MASKAAKKVSKTTPKPAPQPAPQTPATIYKYNFVSQPDDALKCLICKEIAEEPWQHGECGRLFCKKCLDHYGKSKPCYHCEGQQPQYFGDNRSNKEIKALLVRCSSDDCDEAMQLQELEEHVANSCEHTITSCKYVSLGCVQELKRRDMAAHELDRDMHLHMALEMINLLQEERKNGEPLKFLFSDYRKRRDKNERVQSPSYYVSPNGYHMALRVDANGCGEGKGTHVSVFTSILKGRYDSRLKSSFVGKITFTLLNQLEDKNHHQRMVDIRAGDSAYPGGREWGYCNFIAHSKLGYSQSTNTLYLKDDTLYFRMSVEVADRKPWLE